MKISVCTLLFKHRSIEDAIRLSSEIGFDGVEIWGQEGHISANTSIKKAKSIKSVLDYYGQEVPCIASYIADFSTKSDDECQESIVEFEKYMNLMDIIGCNMIRLWPGGPNAFLAQDYHFERAAYWVAKCSDLALQYRKRIALEIHNGSLIESVESADRFMKLLNRENVGLIHDAANMYITDTDYKLRSVSILGGKIFHVHVKDELRIQDDTLPGAFHDITVHGDEIFQQKRLGEGAVDHVPLLKGLIRIGYDGFLSCECHAPGLDIENAKHELKKIRELIEFCSREKLK